MLDWDDLRYFLAVARNGTLTEAARALAVAQPTVGRRIAGLEARLGARLFLRATSGWTLSPVGRDVLEHAEEIEVRALAAETIATGRDAGLEGEVRVTASAWIITSVMGPRLAPLLALNPRLSVDLVADARHLNLARREADLAIRPSRFQHRETFQRELAQVAFGLFAADSYLARHGVPDFANGARGHRLVGAGDRMGRSIVDVEWLPSLVGAAEVVARTNDRLGMAALVAAGVGLGCLPSFLGDATPGVRRLSTPEPGPRRKLWLGVHRSARTVRRVRAVGDFLVELFTRMRPTLDPGS